jgi:hypothetical protein
MPLNRSSLLIAAAALAASALGPAEASAHGRRHSEDFEIWLVDQSNTNGLAHGGTIHIYRGRDLTRRNPSSARPSDVIDLGGAVSALCLASTGANPVRPHMLVFNKTESHAVLSFVASGHVVFFDAPRRRPLACFRTEVGAGGARQAHAVFPAGDDRFILVANQNGKKVERIRTDYRRNSFVQEPAATLDLAGCTTPNGLPCQDPSLRPDTAPICPYTPSPHGPGFISLRGGGLFVIDWRTTPMSILSEYDRTTVPANGCGFIEAHGRVYGNGGGGTTANPDQFTVYRVPSWGHRHGNAPNEPAVELLFDDPAHERDAHGVAVTRSEAYVWVADRDGNVAEVFEGRSGAHVGTVDLLSSYSQDPTPDLIAPSPDRRFFFMSTRGPMPLSGDPHSSLGTDPGLLVMRLTEDGRSGEIRGLVRVSNPDADGVERADPHGIGMRRTGRR